MENIPFYIIIYCINIKIQHSIQQQKAYFLFQNFIYKNKLMKYFMSLLWIFLSVTFVYLIYFKIQAQQDALGAYGQVKLKSQCLKWSDPFSNKQIEQSHPGYYKYCVYCLQKQQIKKFMYFKPLLSFNLSHKKIQNWQPAGSLNSLALMKIKNPKNLSCEQYLNYIETQNSQKSKNIVFTSDTNALKILWHLNAKTQNISSHQKGNRPHQFDTTDYDVKQYVLFQQINRNLISAFPLQPSQVRVKYLNRANFNKGFKTVLNYLLLILFFVCAYVFVLQKRRDGYLENYQNLLLGSIFTYLLIYINFYKFGGNLVIYSLLWTLFIWHFLIKLDNVQKHSFNSPKQYYGFISVIGGLMIYYSVSKGNNLPEIVFWASFMLFYLVCYKIVYRICIRDKKFQNDSTLSTISYQIILICLILEMSIVQLFFKSTLFHEIQVCRHGLLLITPLILIIMTYYQNDEKIQKFIEYTKNNLDEQKIGHQQQKQSENDVTDHSSQNIDDQVEIIKPGEVIIKQNQQQKQIKPQKQ